MVPSRRGIIVPQGVLIPTPMNSRRRGSISPPSKSKPRAGWWRTANRQRLATGALSPRQITHHEALKRQAWQQQRSGARIRAGVLLSVLGALQYGTNKVFWKVVPHCDTYEFRQFIHQLMHTLGQHAPALQVVRGVDRSGIHRAKALQAPFVHDQERFRLPLLPARAGHHLNPMEGFWRVMKDTIGAGRCFAEFPQLYQRTRRVLLTPQEQPISHFSWPDYAPNFA
jgi:DDE superfamily endonuclease